MEDGDDDTPLTTERQKEEEEDQESAENDTVVSKDERNSLSSGEESFTSPTLQRDDSPKLSSTQIEDRKEDTTDEESENKTFSTDPLPGDSSQFLDEDCGEIQDVERESPQSVAHEQLDTSEVYGKTILQEHISELDEEKSVQLYSGEDVHPSVEESENIHSSMEEEQEKEVLEEEEEEENKSFISHNIIASKLSEEYLQEANGSIRESDNQTNVSEDESSAQLEREFTETLKKPDVQHTSDEEYNSQIDKDFVNPNENSGLQCESYEDNCNSRDKKEFTGKLEKTEIQDESNQDECLSQEERVSIFDGSASDTFDENSDEDFEGAVKEEDEIIVELSEVSSPKDNVKIEDTCISESNDDVAQIPFEEEEVPVCKESEDKSLFSQQLQELEENNSGKQLQELEENNSGNDSEVCEIELENKLLVNNALPVISDNEEMSSKNGKAVSERPEESNGENSTKEVVSNHAADEKEVSNSIPNQVETQTDFVGNESSIEAANEKSLEMEVEVAPNIVSKEILMKEADSIQQIPLELENSSVFDKVPSPEQCIQEHSNLQAEEHTENFRSEDNNLCSNPSKNVEKADESEVSVKINGEVELTKNDLLTQKRGVPAKEKTGLKRKLQTSPTQESSCDISAVVSVKGNVHFKGFKKRYIAQVTEATSKEAHDAIPVHEELKVKNKRSAAKKLILESPQVLVSHQQLPDGVQSNTPLTEYAQYLGLQPTVKFKCYNCGESGFPSMLKLQEHQNVCLKNIRIHTYNKPPPTPLIEPAPSTNFRITRKVYLCSACGTYYENWNLFLHMREVHKRHICLFCLLMFSQADKLALHLSAKHGIVDCSYSSPEQFLNEFKGSFFVMCCTCEQMFSERDNFFSHLCRDESVIKTDQACSLCGLKGAHFPTCRRAFTDSNSLASPCHNSQHSSAGHTNDSSQNSQLNVQEKSSTSKYTVQTDKTTTGRKSLHKIPDQNVGRSDKRHNATDLDDEYDISDAASYCHVNIHEPDKQKSSSPNEKTSSRIEIKDETNNNLKKTLDKLQSDEDEEEEDDDDDDCGGDDDDDDDNDDDNDDDENYEKQCKSPEVEETVKSDSEEKVKGDSRNEADNFVLQNETPPQTESVLPPSVNESMDADKVPETDENLDLPTTVPSDTDESKQLDITTETALLNQSKSPKDVGDSESDTSASGADTRDSDVSSSSSEASSDENEQDEKEHQNVAKSDDSDVDKSDSDKMSIVVDEARSEDETDKNVNENNRSSPNIIENETLEINESKHDSSVESDFKIAEEKSFANNNETSETGEEQQENVQIAGDDVPLLELTLEETLDVLSIQTVVKECVKISCSTCVYCNHAKKIAVNGKQLVLHLLAEHRFEPVVCSDSGELTPVYGFVDNLKTKLSELQDMYFNTDTYDSADMSFTRPYDRTYECFHCHFITTLHKELYVHNRKMHQKTILLCIMCKSNFYSYSELLCHLCPGIYVPDSNILFRCCLCIVDGLPSAFRLMVHLRKRHHACDVCLETTGDQQKLSNHVWKHKLHHLCYRCGIAYRNKPDITKHLFWKHGTESVLCKKCLQKKWPHVYHFCIPPTAFLCEECNASFSRAVALKVHKRLHAGDISYQCEECEEKFISKRLLRRHKEKHKQVNTEKENHENERIEENELHHFGHTESKLHQTNERSEDVNKDMNINDPECVLEKSTAAEGGSPKKVETPEETASEAHTTDLNKPHEVIHNNKKSKVVDVYDLPPLNLSSESDDSDDEQTSKQVSKDVDVEDSSKTVPNEDEREILKSQEGEPQTEEEIQPVQIVDGVWDNFKTYKANLEKREILQAQASGSLKTSCTSLINYSVENHAIVDVVMADHDYCVLPEKIEEEKQNSPLTTDADQIQSSCTIQGTIQTEFAENLDDKGSGFEADHNYCFSTSPHPEEKKEPVVSDMQVASIPPLQTPPLPIPHSSPSPPPSAQSVPTPSPKKKQKSPKKKQKQSGSSSSSDSSSNSDSSSCTCGTNCSCSSSSSSSSGSSSTSSDSDSSSSEGRRRQAVKRDRRRERAKRKLDSGSKGGSPPPTGGFSVEAGAAGTESAQVPMQIDSSGAGTLQVDDSAVLAFPEPEENEFLIRESDLDTTETETDEDFYDKYPQKQANKLLAEKRNQLLLLAAVAPVNNGTIAQPSPPPAPEVPEPIQKKKGKTKRHKKGQHNSSEKKVENKLKLNIPVSYYSSPSFPVSSAGHPVSPLTNSQNPTSSHTSRLSHDTFSPVNPDAASTPTAYHSTGSGSETESKRLSKRKRIPKKFYGDSSDEEAEHTPHQPYKWRKVTASVSNNPPAQPASVSSGFGYRGVTCSVPAPEPVHVQPLLHQEKSDEEEGDESESGHEAKRSSSDSSNSDSDNEQSDADSDNETVTVVSNTVTSVTANTTQQKNENLYCYCQCPYDEVSEMIACDGKDCSIEWFHFECVGIMVPPKGKWFCPDCRKKTGVRNDYSQHP